MSLKNWINAAAFLSVVVAYGGAAEAQSGSSNPEYDAWVAGNQMYHHPITGLAGQIYSVAQNGAALVTRRVAVRETFQSGPQILGYLSPGDVVCISNNSTIGPDGFLNIALADNGALMGGDVPNDGTLVPAQSAGQCSSIAEQLDSSGNPQEVAQEAAAAVVQQQVTAQQNADELDDMGKFLENMLPLLAATVLMFFFLSQRYPKLSKKAGTPLSEEQKNALFPGFIIKRDELYMRGNELYRVNDSGEGISLKKWLFTKETGEFYKITGDGGGGNVVVSTLSYRERWRAYWKFSDSRKIWAWPPMAFFCSFGLLFIYLGASENDKFTSWVGILLGIPGFLLLPWCMWPKTAFEAKIAGPEPLRREIHDYGPETATSPVDHPAADDLTY